MDHKRILFSCFAYRDKNAGTRNTQVDLPVKAQARLCIGGHEDPDLAMGEMRTDAPTVSRLSLLCFLQLCASLGWVPKTGDIEAAFLNGEEKIRNLYMHQPKEGLPGTGLGCLVEVIKGVFGLATSPRLWWCKMARQILQNGDKGHLRVHRSFHPTPFGSLFVSS